MWGLRQAGPVLASFMVAFELPAGTFRPAPQADHATAPGTPPRTGQLRKMSSLNGHADPGREVCFSLPVTNRETEAQWRTLSEGHPPGGAQGEQL